MYILLQAAKVSVPREWWREEARAICKPQTGGFREGAGGLSASTARPLRFDRHVSSTPMKSFFRSNPSSNSDQPALLRKKNRLSGAQSQSDASFAQPPSPYNDEDHFFQQDVPQSNPVHSPYPLHSPPLASESLTSSPSMSQQQGFDQSRGSPRNGSNASLPAQAHYGGGGGGDLGRPRDEQGRVLSPSPASGGQPFSQRQPSPSGRTAADVRSFTPPSNQNNRPQSFHRQGSPSNGHDGGIRLNSYYTPPAQGGGNPSPASSQQLHPVQSSSRSDHSHNLSPSGPSDRDFKAMQSRGGPQPIGAPNPISGPAHAKTIAGEPLHDLDRAVTLLKSSSKFYMEGFLMRKTEVGADGKAVGPEGGACRLWTEQLTGNSFDPAPH